jgi:hypothetical protein
MQSGAYTNQVTAFAIEADPQPANNTARNTVVAATPDERRLEVEFLSAPDRLVVQWPVSAVPFKLQSNSVLGDTNVPWITISPLPLPTNGTNHFTNSSPINPATYYRLRYP